MIHSVRLLSSVVLSVAILSQFVESNPAPHTGRQCRAVPGGPGWPSADRWVALNSTVGGRLIAPVPPAAPCHADQASYNETTCTNLKAAFKTYDFYVDIPVGSQVPAWDNDTCLPLETAPCSAAGYPAYVINATSATDVKAGVDFARKHKIRLVVRASGHDFLGRSNAPNSLSIWTHGLKGIKLFDSFKPRGCKTTINTTGLVAGAGSYMRQLNEAAAAAGRAMISGGGPTVTLGGYLTGGGHGLLSPRYGMAADQVLEFEVVTPTGDIVTANECQNQDLFWALRGGGGGTFGVITKVATKTFPSPNITAIAFVVGSFPPDRSGFEAGAYLISQFPYLERHGVSGYSYIFLNYTIPYPGSNLPPLSGLAMSVVLQDRINGSLDATGIFAPLRQNITARWPTALPLVFDTTEYPSFMAWWEAHHDTVVSGDNSVVTSRLLDETALSKNLTALTAAYETLADVDGTGTGAATAYLVSGRGVWNARPRGGGNAVNPAWRKALSHTTAGQSWTHLDYEGKSKRAAYSRADASLEPLRKLAPDSGAYVNEAFPEEPDWRHAFWGRGGKNYARLLRIKRAVDPDDVLWCHPCVGNERWEEIDGGVLCRVEDKDKRFYLQ
ncbi:FAD-binding domain-containing protein [Rhypophila decipiens]|uniref:FAD-binding domain-containing protein n=1 Tax=Rhypophila decipiens TaxID=261697 RepID=A0AAN6XY80_9PEZI|nr:FAD-binding domain-containing protein [Rhypophila decipiens]